MATQALKLFAQTDNADVIAGEIVAAINGSPHTPCREAIAEIIRKHAADADGTAPCPLVSDQLTWFEVPKTLAANLSPAMAQFRDLQRKDRHPAKQTRSDDVDVDRLALNDLARAIIDRPVSSYQDLREKALVVEEFYLGWLRQGGYVESTSDSISARSLLALIDGVLAFQGAAQAEEGRRTQHADALDDLAAAVSDSDRAIGGTPVLLSAKGREYVVAQLDVEAAEEAQDEEAIEAATERLRSVEVAIITKTATDWSDVVDKAHVANSRTGTSCAIALASVVQAALEMGGLNNV